MTYQQGGNSRRVLRGYKQKGKRFVPPMLQYIPLEESRWIYDRIPELVWIALLMQSMGIKRGNAIATAIAQAAAKFSQARKAFAAASDYLELNEEQKEQIRVELDNKEMLGSAQTALATLISHYEGFPLAFIQTPNSEQQDVPETTLEDLENAIHTIFDRESREATIVQATAVHIYFTNGLLKVASGTSLENLNTVLEYPGTEDSQRVAASVRAIITLLIGKEVNSDWASSFWRQGRTLTPCKVVNYGGA